jgi:surfeit locus 1 family protein
MLTTLRDSRLLWPTIMTVLALPMLIGLGVWQLQRKAWKDGLIAAIAERTKQGPSDLKNAYSATYAPPYEKVGFEYMRVTARGRYHHDKERYYYAPDPVRGPGYHVYTPFEISGNGAIVFVNRGYVPEQFKAPDQRQAGQVAGEFEVTGLLRGPETKQTFTPDNDRARNLWYWRDFSGMFRSAFENTERPYIPVFVDAEGDAPGGWPQGGVTRVDLPNRHLEYAITWFGLAGALAAVFAAFVMGRLRGE